MKLTDIELGVIDYIHQEIAAKATGLTKFLIYTGSFLGAAKGEKLIAQYLPILQQMDLIDEEGDIDIEALYNAAKQGIKQSGSFEYKGIIFDEKDIDKLYNYIKNKGVKQ